MCFPVYGAFRYLYGPADVGFFPVCSPVRFEKSGLLQVRFPGSIALKQWVRRMASGPAALDTLRSERSLVTPAVEITISCRIKNLHCRHSGRLTREVAPFNIVV